MAGKLCFAAGILIFSMNGFAAPTQNAPDESAVPKECTEMFSNLPLPSTQDMAEMEKLDISSPVRKLSRIDIHYTARFQGSGADGWNWADSRLIFYRTDGLVQQCILTPDLQRVVLDYRGLIDLGYYIPGVAFTKMSEISLQGDWRHLPIGQASHIFYTKTLNKLDRPETQSSAAAGEKGGLTCLVTAQISASTLHPKLQGIAKVLECTANDEDWRGVKMARSNYLVDYGVTVLAEQHSTTGSDVPEVTAIITDVMF